MQKNSPEFHYFSPIIFFSSLHQFSAELGRKWPDPAQPSVPLIPSRALARYSAAEAPQGRWIPHPTDGSERVWNKSRARRRRPLVTLSPFSFPPSLPSGDERERDDGDVGVVRILSPELRAALASAQLCRAVPGGALAWRRRASGRPRIGVDDLRQVQHRSELQRRQAHEETSPRSGVADGEVARVLARAHLPT